MGEEKYLPESMTCHHTQTEYAMDDPEKMIQLSQELDQDFIDSGWRPKDGDESTWNSHE